MTIDAVIAYCSKSWRFMTVDLRQKKIFSYGCDTTSELIPEQFDGFEALECVYPNFYNSVCVTVNHACLLINQKKKQHTQIGQNRGSAIYGMSPCR